MVAFYKEIFSGNDGFKIFQQVGSKKILDPLEHHDKDRTEETENNLKRYASDLVSLSSWDELQQKPELVKQIFSTCNLFDIDVRAAITDHGLEVGCDVDSYYNYASSPQIWLNNSEIAAYLLTLGYLFENSEKWQGGTVVRYANSEGRNLFLYNNAQDLSVNTAGQGTHWEACTKTEEDTLEGLSTTSIVGTDISYIDKYWGKYTISAISEIIDLRMEEVDLKENVMILEGRFIDSTSHNILGIVEQMVAYSFNKNFLVPLNLFDKHAVGLVFEKKGDILQITYMDPSNEAIPLELRCLLCSVFSRLCPGVEIILKELSMEQQKYTNCGPEVVENFIYYLTNTRVSQEEAVKLHSELVMGKLLNHGGLGLVFTSDDCLPNSQEPVLGLVSAYSDIYE